MNKNTYNINWFESLDSTQTYLKSLDLDFLPEWSIVATKNQTNGRGQSENKWESEDGKDITFSILLKPTFLSIADQFIITQVLSLGIFDFLSKYMHDIFIKWPNDIYIKKNKICGILVQNIIIGAEYSCAICGIGLNVNHTVFHFAPNPTSMKLETGKEFPIEDILFELLDCIKFRYDALKLHRVSDFKKEYLGKLLYYKVWAKYSYNMEDIDARIVDVNEFGHLVLIKKGEKKVTVELKELKFYHELA